MVEVEYHNLGIVAYGECWEVQREYFNALLSGDGGAKLILCEHPSVYTIGKSGKDSNILVSEQFLKSIGAEVYHIDRGGDVTFHGKGQLVGYPIVDLKDLGIGVRDYVSVLEQCVIDTLAHYGIESRRSEGASGVWIDSPMRKICAVGVKASRGVTMHGFALNVNTDMSFFDHINPCGFNDRGVTSMAMELGNEVDLEGVKEHYLLHFEKLLNVRLKNKNYVNTKTLGS